MRRPDGYYYVQKPKVVERPKCEAKPHALPWITKEMLMGARAPLIRVRHAPEA